MKELETIVWEEKNPNKKFTITADQLLGIWQHVDRYPDMVDGCVFSMHESNEPRDNIREIIRNIVKGEKQWMM